MRDLPVQILIILLLAVWIFLFADCRAEGYAFVDNDDYLQWGAPKSVREGTQHLEYYRVRIFNDEGFRIHICHTTKVLVADLLEGHEFGEYKVQVQAKIKGGSLSQWTEPFKIVYLAEYKPKMIFIEDNRNE